MLVIYSYFNSFDVSETGTRGGVTNKGKEALGAFYFVCLLGHIQSLPAQGLLARPNLSLLSRPPHHHDRPQAYFYQAQVISVQTSQLRLVCSVTDEPLAVQSRVVTVFLIF